MYTFLTIVMTAFLLIAIASAKATRTRHKFTAEYNLFLAEHEGLEIFCYTNRLKFCDAIEAQLVPTLDEHIHVIKLNGKVPQTRLNERVISHALCNLKGVGFPNVMRVVDGKFIDSSLHKPIYDAINNNNTNLLPSLVHDKLRRLRDLL